MVAKGPTEEVLYGNGRQGFDGKKSYTATVDKGPTEEVQYINSRQGSDRRSPIWQRSARVWREEVLKGKGRQGSDGDTVDARAQQGRWLQSARIALQVWRNRKQDLFWKVNDENLLVFEGRTYRTYPVTWYPFRTYPHRTYLRQTYPRH